MGLYPRSQLPCPRGGMRLDAISYMTPQISLPKIVRPLGAAFPPPPQKQAVRAWAATLGTAQ